MSITKHFVARVFANEGVGTDFHDVNVMHLLVTRDDLVHWIRHMPHVADLAATDQSLAMLDELAFNTRTAYYALDNDDDTEGEIDDFLDSFSDIGFLVLDELPEWWDLRALEVPSDRDLMHISKHLVSFSAIEHYSGDFMTAGTITSKELETFLAGFDTSVSVGGRELTPSRPTLQSRVQRIVTVPANRRNTMPKPVVNELEEKLPEPIREAIQEMCDTAFECGEWNANDSDEMYETVSDRAAVAKDTLIQGVLALTQRVAAGDIQGDAPNQGDIPSASESTPDADTAALNDVLSSALAWADDLPAQHYGEDPEEIAAAEREADNLRENIERVEALFKELRKPRRR